VVFSACYSFSPDYSPKVGQCPPICLRVIVGSRQSGRCIHRAIWID